MLLNCGVGEDPWESHGLQRDQTNHFWRKSVLNIHWKDWCWSWNSLATLCEELTHWKRPWCWEILKAGGEGNDRGWDGWMALLTWWTWMWASSGSWWWTGKPGVLRSMGSQKVGHNWVTKLNWTEFNNLNLHARCVVMCVCVCGWVCGCVCVSGSLLIHPTLPFPHCVHRFLLCLHLYSCPANRYIYTIFSRFPLHQWF